MSDRLSANFSRAEFACKGTDCCGNSAPVDPRLVAALQALRDAIGVPLRITSGFRCRTHNKRISKASESYHTLGMAVDIVCKLPPRELAVAAEMIPAFRDGGIGTYPSWVHVDVRKGRARW